MTRRVVLCVLEGVGVRAERDGNAVALASTPVLDALGSKHPSTTLSACGPAVGQREGAHGDGAHSFLVLGAGRSVPSERDRIDAAIAAEKFGSNEMIDQTMRICLYDKCPIHLFALLSSAHDHASMAHLYATLDLCEFHEIPVVIHGIVDGHRGRRRGAMRLIEKLEVQLSERNATIGTLSGSHYAMDRDERWDRTYGAYHAIVRDKTLGSPAPAEENAFDAIAQSYGRDIDDEHLVPVRLGDYRGLRGEFMCDFASEGAPWIWTGEDAGLALHHRDDGLRQLTQMFTLEALPRDIANDLLMDRQYPMLAFRQHCFATLTDYGDDIVVPVAYKRKKLDDTLGSIVASADLGQVRITESARASHALRHFSGLHDEPFAGETRHIVRSPQLIDRWEEQPALCAAKVAQAAAQELDDGDAALLVVNLANGDILAHGGDLARTIEALEAVDAALGTVAAAAERAGATLIVVGSHGSCEQMVQGDEPHCAHTQAPVPFITTHGGALRNDGSIADVAPTILALLHLEQPTSMTGRSLYRDGAE